MNGKITISDEVVKTLSENEIKGIVRNISRLMNTTNLPNMLNTINRQALNTPCVGRSRKPWVKVKFVLDNEITTALVDPVRFGVTLLDDSDADKILSYGVRPSLHQRGLQIYDRVYRSGFKIMLHRFISPDKYCVEYSDIHHINQSPFDNRQRNLVCCLDRDSHKFLHSKHFENSGIQLKGYFQTFKLEAMVVKMNGVRSIIHNKTVTVVEEQERKYA